MGTTRGPGWQGRRVSELVDHGEQQAAGTGRLLPCGLGGEHDTDDEPLRTLPRIVQVDHGDLLVDGGDLPGAGVGQVRPDQGSQGSK